MSEYDNGFARAQARYEAQEQPDHSQDMCECGQVWEEHFECDFEGVEYWICPGDKENVVRYLAERTYEGED